VLKEFEFETLAVEDEGQVEVLAGSGVPCSTPLPIRPLH
jgi:hypothetical protein